MLVGPVRVALVVGALVATFLALAWGQLWAVFAIPVGVLALVGAMELKAQDDAWEADCLEPRAVFLSRESVFVSDELVELLKSAMELADRSLGATGGFRPFVVYEDRDTGAVRMRAVPRSELRDDLASARQHARGVHPDVERVALAVQGHAEVDGRRRRVVIYEAAERYGNAQTLTFAQRYEPRRLLLPATTRGRPLFTGRAAHRLRMA